jgi:hypothetical protein
MFSGTKQIVIDRLARLGSKVFEELTIMGSAWGLGIYDAAAWNAMQVEEVSLFDFNFEEMLADDMDMVEWDKNEGMDSDGFELEV